MTFVGQYIPLHAYTLYLKLYFVVFRGFSLCLFNMKRIKYYLIAVDLLGILIFHVDK
jgi:hypothetical protein